MGPRSGLLVARPGSGLSGWSSFLPPPSDEAAGNPYRQAAFFAAAPGRPRRELCFSTPSGSLPDTDWLPSSFAERQKRALRCSFALPLPTKDHLFSSPLTFPLIFLRLWPALILFNSISLISSLIKYLFFPLGSIASRTKTFGHWFNMTSDRWAIPVMDDGEAEERVVFFVLWWFR